MSRFGLRALVGLTGSIGSGKSYARRHLEDFGACCVDADALGHRVYSGGGDGFNAVVAEFGPRVVDSASGAIDRKALGKIVFADKDAMSALTRIVWPRIVPLVSAEFMRAPRGSVGVLEAAVLIEAGWVSMVDEVWLTTVPRAEAVVRVVERNHVSVEVASERLNAQLSDAERGKHASVVIDTSGPVAATRELLRYAWNDLLARHPPVC